MIKKTKCPLQRDVVLAYLIEDARRTKNDGYAIIEPWMVSTTPPKDIVQWDRRRDIGNKKETAICFYCNDYTFTPILNNPRAYLEKLKEYSMVVGIDASPYDNMPPVVQKSQIYLNIGLTYYFGKNNIKVIPNVRVGSDETLSSLDAYPKNTLIAIGTNGFVKSKYNRAKFSHQIKQVIETLDPTGICVYGPIKEGMFSSAIERNIPIYQYDSYSMKENKKLNLLEGRQHERQ